MSLSDFKKDAKKVPKSLIKLYGNKDFDVFLEKADEFMKIHPDNLMIYLYKGLIFEEKGQFEKAINYFDVVLEVVPFPSFYKNKGHCHIKIGEYLKAREAYLEFLRYKESDAGSWGFVAISFYLEDKKDVALGLLDHALGLVEDKTIIFLLKSMILEREELEDDALINLIQSQISAKNEEQKQVSGEYISKFFNK